MLFDFGQPDGGIVQIAFTVEDARVSAESWTRLTGIGPWCFRGPFTSPSPYQGRQGTARLVVAQAFSGHTMIELIQPLDNEPSVYRDVIEKRGFGFHHVAVGATDHSTAVAGLREEFGEAIYESVLPTRARVSYFDATPMLGGMLEVVEINPAQEAVYTRGFVAAQTQELEATGGP